MRSRFGIGWTLLALAIVAGGIVPATSLAAAAEPSGKPTKVLIVVGPSTHPPGSHEVAAGGRLLADTLNHLQNVTGISAEVVYDWPTDDALLDRVATVVFIGDTFPPQRLPNTSQTLARLGKMMDRGCGIVCLHYATGLRNEDVAKDGEHPLLHWMGGYFATKCEHHQSVARIYDAATIIPAAGDHPVMRGWKTFTLKDEPYINNYFGKDGNKLSPNVVALATSMLPPEAPKKEIVGWAVERADGGRGMGLVMPHFYGNWRNEDLRRFILNGVVWTAGLNVPEGGVQSASPDLAKYEPASVEPIAKPAKSKDAAKKQPASTEKEAVSASDSKPPPAVPASVVGEHGFASLFDGKTLDGWTCPDLSFWRVEDGAITGEVTDAHKPKQTTFLVSKAEPVTDFELTFRFRIYGEGSNSGMQFRSEVMPDGRVMGYQADIDGACRVAAGIFDEFGPRKSLVARGERATWSADGKKTVEKISDPFGGKPADLTQWTDYHLVAKGSHMTLSVNGQVACELIDNDPRHRASGILAVPVIARPMKVQYKDIKLKRLAE